MSNLQRFWNMFIRQRWTVWNQIHLVYILQTPRFPTLQHNMIHITTSADKVTELKHYLFEHSY